MNQNEIPMLNEKDIDPTEALVRLQQIEENKKKQDFIQGVKDRTGLKGSKVAFCPKCKLYMPVLFLRFEDKLGHQTIGYACSGCEKPLIGITRRKPDGKVIRRFVEPGVKLT